MDEEMMPPIVLTPEMSRWFDRIIRTCDVFERGPMMQAALDVARSGTPSDPVRSIYDERVADDLRDFLLEKAERL